MFDETVTVAKFINKFKIFDSKSRLKNSITQKHSPNTSLTRNIFLTKEPINKR